MNRYINNQPLILASSSKYRQRLLQRLGIQFTCISPQIDEKHLANEPTPDLVKRLSIEKAEIVARKHPQAWVVGSDQIAVFGQDVLGKPANKEAAQAQLTSFSGNRVDFLTGVCLVHIDNSVCSYHCSKTEVYFKELSSQTIKQYLAYDEPFDCAGSFKVESLGVCLFEKVSSDDPTALEGLPLIGLCQLFEKAGFNIFRE